MGHSHDRLVEVLVDRLVEDGVEQHDGRLGSLEPEPLLTHVARVQEPLEHLGGIEPPEDVALLVGRELGRDAFDVLLDPLLLFGVLDVHVFDTQRPAVGVAEDVEDLVQGGHVLAGQPVGHELPGQVPDGQPVVERVELGVELGRLGVERIEVGDEVTADPVHVDERLDVHLLDQSEVGARPFVVRGVDVAFPADRLVGDLQRLEDLVVEAVAAHQALGDVGQEEARLGPLDDPVVVGGGEGHCLADTQIRPGCGCPRPRNRVGRRGHRRRR